MTVPRLAVLSSPDEQVRVLALLLVAACRQLGGELRINNSVIDSCNEGHVLEQDYDAVPGHTVIRVIDLPAELVHALAVSMRTLADELSDAPSPDAPDALVIVPHDLVR